MSQPTMNQSTAGEKTLEDWRQQIDRLDSELISLLNKRAGIACEIAVIKVASGLPAYDPKREEQVMERIAAKNGGPFDDESVRAIFRSIIHETRRLGTERMQAFSDTPKRSEGSLRAKGVAREPISSGKQNFIE